MLVTPGDISIRRKDTNARRTGSPGAAFDTWPLTAPGSAGLVWAPSASGNNRSAPIQRMISEWHNQQTGGTDHRLAWSVVLLPAVTTGGRQTTKGDRLFHPPLPVPPAREQRAGGWGGETL